MSWRREVLIIKNPWAITKKGVNWNKKSHIKMLKMALLDCAITMKNVAVLTEDGALALFFRPHPRGFDSSRVPTPGICHPRQKNANAKGLARGGGWAQVELSLTDALPNLTTGRTEGQELRWLGKAENTILFFKFLFGWCFMWTRLLKYLLVSAWFTRAMHQLLIILHTLHTYNSCKTNKQKNCRNKVFMKNHPNGSLKNIMVFAALANWLKGYRR